MNTALLHERPGCRRYLMKATNIVPDVRNGIWDGRTIRDLDRRDADNGGYYEISTFLSDGLRKQFYLLLEEGHYGDIEIRPPKPKWRYSLDDIRHFGSNHRYPYGRCAECAKRRLGADAKL